MSKEFYSNNFNGNRKEYLNQYKLVQERIKVKTMQFNHLNDRLFEISGISYDDVKIQKSVDNDAPYVSIILKMDVLENEIKELKSRSVKTYCEVSKSINKLKDSRYIQLLTLRYLKLYSWDKIAFKMNYNLSYLHRMHNNALNALNKKRRLKGD